MCFLPLPPTYFSVILVIERIDFEFSTLPILTKLRQAPNVNDINLNCKLTAAQRSWSICQQYLRYCITCTPQ